MKKTLTVNLGGTVFHIDEDAYRLLDNYLSNLKIHFRKEAGADEIIDDIERRISELFTEKLAAGSQVITIAYVEEVIARMGKPEELEPDAGDAGFRKRQLGRQQPCRQYRCRRFRNCGESVSPFLSQSRR